MEKKRKKLWKSQIDRWSKRMLRYMCKNSTTGRKRIKRTVGGMREMTYSEYFVSVKTQFMGADVSDITEHLAFQFNVTGEASGIFYVEVKDGKLYIEPYEYHDCDAMFIGTAELFTAIMKGEKDPVQEFLCHRLKVEGNIDKALKLKDLIERNK